MTPDPPPLSQSTAAQRAPVRRHHWVVRATHWLSFVLLVGMVASGLQIYGAYARFGERGGPLYQPNPFQDTTLPAWARLGGWLAGALNWHFALMWVLIAVGLVYVLYLAGSGEWRALLFRPRDLPAALEMARYYVRLRADHPPQGKHNPLQKLAYTSIVLVGALAVLSGFAIYKPVQLAWLTTLLGGFQLARYWHFWTVWIFVGFLVTHVVLVFAVDPASLRAMVTGWYRGRFASRD